MASHRPDHPFADDLKVERRIRLDRFGSVDGKDLKILEALQVNARVALSELGRAIGLSQPAISERVKRLEEAGIIEGYGARVNPRALGLGLMALVRLRTSHEHIKTCLRKFGEIPNIIEVHRVTGEDCFVLKVLVPAPEDLETIVDRIAGFGAVTTSLVLRSEPVRPIGRELLRKKAE
ncbi:Lrp/AsnC family transcriptional regulator [Bradyrhizobium liaoningense]|nr:Lrp/AsnC family transcriptional regulator [Bradyrhizobium liaoningense]